MTELYRANEKFAFLEFRINVLVYSEKTEFLECLISFDPSGGLTRSKRQSCRLDYGDSK